MSPGPILFLMSDQGGGHRAAALALIEALGRVAPAPVETEMLDFIDVAGAIPSARVATLYRLAVNHAAPLHASIWRIADRAPGLARALVRAGMPRARRRLGALLRRRPPRVVVSVYPLANHETARALAAIEPRPPFVTVVTDLGHPPAVWFARGLDLYVVPCEGGRDRALAAGVPEDRLRVLGLPLGAAFAAPPSDRAALRRRLGLEPGRRTVLVVGGGEGMGRLEAIARAVEGSGLALQQVVVAGRNEPLRRRLEAATWRVPTVVHGFVSNMSELMDTADVVVTKAGPHTVTEAMARGCALVLSGFVPAQEAGVVRMVVEAGAGILADTPAGVVAALRSLFAPGSDAFARMGASARRLARPGAAEDIARLVLDLGRR